MYEAAAVTFGRELEACDERRVGNTGGHSPVLAAFPLDASLL